MGEQELVDVVRRVVAARVRDRHVVEDITQEALLRVTATERRLTPDSRQAYAIVTARHLVADRARADATHHRHAHRLVDYTSLDGPERLVLEREETDALATALDRLDPDDRALLLAHEVEGATTAELAADAPGASAGSIAMRLARARATLRLEYLLTFRRVELPTARCRPVLLALSTGDRRRQLALRAGEHLLQCRACSELVRPLTERRRALAGFLLLPIDALRRAVGALRRSTRAQIGTAAVVTAGLVALFVATRSSGSEDSIAPAAPPSSVVASSSAPAPSPVPSTSAAPPSVAPTTTAAVAPAPVPTTVAAVGTVPIEPLATCPTPQPLDQTEPLDLFGCPIAATTLTATAVTTDEGFWATTDGGQAVWVQLSGEGESPVDIDVGTTIDVIGVINPVPGDARDPALVAAGFLLDVSFGSIVGA